MRPFLCCFSFLCRLKEDATTDAQFLREDGGVPCNNSIPGQSEEKILNGKVKAEKISTAEDLGSNFLIQCSSLDPCTLAKPEYNVNQVTPDYPPHGSLAILPGTEDKFRYTSDLPLSATSLHNENFDYGSIPLDTEESSVLRHRKILTSSKLV